MYWRKILFPCLVAILAWPLASRAEESRAWPDWDRFAGRFMQADGRIIDLTFDGKSTSEGQSYGLFFALVANQPERFATILKWTSDNLADSELGEKLPGWLWGKRDDGSWGIKDRNAASDADLWIAYSLLEAGRLWQMPRYDALGRKLLKLIADREVVRAGKYTLLLPGPVGFSLAQNRYRVNPSYIPGFMFAYLASVDRGGPWKNIWDSYVDLAPKIYASGVAPDLIVINNKGQVMQDTERAPLGSYDAIRVYLWAGMSGEHCAQLVRMLTPYAKAMRASGKPPEKMNPANGSVVKADWSPPGFSGAVLPFVSALRDDDLVRTTRQTIRTQAAEAQAGGVTHYYDQVLLLFGKGYDEGFYRFDDGGRVKPKWNGQLAARN